MNVYNFATANLSFAFALGIPMGSEKKWLQKFVETKESDLSDQNFLKAKAEDTMKLIANEFMQDRLDAIGLQELNKFDHNPGIQTFIKAFSESGGDVNNFEKVERDAPSENVEVFIKGIGKYCIISFGVIQEKGTPTVALIYNTEKLGYPIKIFCEDCEVAGQDGRPMLGVITDMGFGLISMHAPNVNPYLNPPPHLKDKQDRQLMRLMDSDRMQNYFKRRVERETVSRELSQIYELINRQFMTPMVNKITNFIQKLKNKGNKIVLMGDMNDPDPMKDGSLSNQLNSNLGLQFFPGNPTCCYNWDSSKIGDDVEEYTNWIFGHGHPDDKLNEDVIAENRGNVVNVKNRKLQKRNYAYKGDLIYYESEFRLNGNGQKELFPQSDDTITSQYSDHVFQKISLALNNPIAPQHAAADEARADPESASGARGGKVRKTKKVRKRPTKKRKRPIKKRKHTKKRRAGKSSRTR